MILTIATYIARFSFNMTLKFTTSDVTLVMSCQNDVMEILSGTDKNAIAHLISTECQEIGTILQIISMDGSGADDRAKRREINCAFMDCLEKVQSGDSPALLWLKRHVDFQVCDIMLSDWNYSGTKVQVIKEWIAIKKKAAEKAMAEKARG